MWDLFITGSKVVGMIVLYALVAGCLALWVSRRLQYRALREEGRIAEQAPGRADRRARSWVELPRWVNRHREWAAAVVVLAADPIAGRTERFVDFHSRRVDWIGLREASRDWDAKDRRFVEVADELAHPEPEQHGDSDDASAVVGTTPTERETPTSA